MESKEVKINNVVAYRSGFNTGYTLGKLNKSQRLDWATRSIAEKNPHDSFCFGLLKGYHQAEREMSQSKDQRMTDLENINKNKPKEKGLER